MNNTKRILAENYTVSNDTEVTALNNNDLIVGPSGAGKTGGYVIPNMLEADSSMIVADTKCSLYRKLGPVMRSKGYNTYVVDFVDPAGSCAYNPFDYIREKENGTRSMQDIITISQTLIPLKRAEDAYWIESGQNVLQSLIAFTLEVFPAEEQNLCTVTALYRLLISQCAVNGSHGVDFLEEYALINPDSFAVKKYRMFKGVIESEKTWGCITQFISNALSLFDLDDIGNMFGREADFRLEEIGREKTVVFLNISDCDRSFDGIVNLFYTQAIQELTKEADSRPSRKLDVPVRIILDDFATNAYIPNFEKTISVIRSREISVSIILQSLSQLETMYSASQSKTIINNCDHIIYLGGTDLDTTNYISNRVSKPPEQILSMPLDKVWILERGKPGAFVDKLRPYSMSIPKVADEFYAENAPTARMRGFEPRDTELFR